MYGENNVKGGIKREIVENCIIDVIKRFKNALIILDYEHFPPMYNHLIQGGMGMCIHSLTQCFVSGIFLGQGSGSGSWGVKKEPKFGIKI